MLQVDMTARVRQDFGKGAMRRLRRSGQTPAVLYGPKSEPLALSLETKNLTKELLKMHGQNAVVGLDIEGGETKKKLHVMIKEIQKNPIQDTVVHADFYEISLEKPTTLYVPIEVKGTPKGVDMGGILHLPVRKVLMRGLPLDIPDRIETDISALELDGPGLTCKDLAIPENVTLLDDEDKVCAVVLRATRAEALPEIEEAEAEGAGEEAAEAAPSGSEETS